MVPRPLSFIQGACYAILFCVCAFAAFTFGVHLADAPTRIPIIERVLAPLQNDTLLVTGDVMLARGVEWLIRDHEFSYPFLGVRDLFAEYDAVLVNFEGTVPEVHTPTPSMGFSFSIAEDIARSLASFGITHAGLANNHALDFGVSGYTHARDVFEDSDIVAFGDPSKVAAEGVVTIGVGRYTVAFVPIHAVFKEVTKDDLHAAFAQASTSDVQIAYVHWGTEYEPMHSTAQERMAQAMIAEGADAIIGHHPHVVQDIQTYDGVPVFYSLGNFVFDQYFSSAVKEGLLLGLSGDREGIQFSLIPVRSTTKSQPAPLAGAEREAFLEELSKRSDASLRDGVLEGELFLPVATKVQ